jgi:hypothetical protein
MNLKNYQVYVYIVSVYWKPSIFNSYKKPQSSLGPHQPPLAHTQKPDTGQTSGPTSTARVGRIT